MIPLANIFARFREQSGMWLSRIFILALLSLIFFIAIGGVSHNDKWQIIKIDVKGANVVSEDEVRSLALEKILGSYFLVYARNNSYLFPSGEIVEDLLSTFPRIASVQINRINNNSIVINLTERKPFALWCGVDTESRDCWFIDEAGYVFDKSPVFSSGVYLEVHGALVEKNAGEVLRSSVPYDRFVTANTFAKLLIEDIGKPYRIIFKEKGELEVSVLTSSKYPFLSDVDIRFKDESIPETLLRNLLSAIPLQFPNNLPLKKELQYIDMRFGNKVIFGFEN